MTVLATTAREARPRTLADEHSVLLWQTCAFADELVDATGARGTLLPAYDRMLGFLHHRLLPYLGAEERRLPTGELRDGHLAGILLADHDRIRADVENVEAARTRRLLSIATSALVTRLDRHVQREASWVSADAQAVDDVELSVWMAPILLADEIDLDALPHDVSDRLVLARLRQLRPGDTVRLRAAHDLHPVWVHLQRLTPGEHAWAYDEQGPEVWTATIRRRSAGA
jgi:uncharacterized protein (DUF2249 family)